MLVGHQGREPVETLGARRVEQVVAVEVEQVEEVRRHDDPGRLGGARRGLLERPGPAGVVEGEGLAVEHEPLGRAARGRPSTTSGSRSVMSSRLRVAITTSSPVRCTWIRMPSSFTSTATGCPPPAPALAIAAARSGALEASIGSTGRPTSSPTRRERRLAALERGADDRHGAAGEHRRAAYGLQRHLRGRGDGLLDQAVERALADVAGQGAAQPRLLGGGRAAEERRERLRARRLRAAARERGDGVERLVHLGDGQARLGRRLDLGGGAAPADAGAALAQGTAEVRRHGLELVGGGPPQAAGQRLRPWPCASGWPRRRRTCRRPRGAARSHYPVVEQRARQWPVGPHRHRVCETGRVTDRLYVPRFNAVDDDEALRLVAAVGDGPAGDRGRGRHPRRHVPARADARRRS